MKRSLLAIPLAALAAGLLLLLWIKRPGTSISPVAPSSPAETAGAAEKAAPGAPARPSAPPKSPAPPTPGSLLLRVTAGGRPLPDAEVSLVREDVPGRMRVKVGPDGTHLILQIPAGDYAAGASHPRYLPAEAHVSVPANGRATVDIELATGARIYGRATDRAGAPLPGTNVYLLDAQMLAVIGSPLPVKCDEEGRYQLPPAPRGEFTVRFKHERFKVHDRPGVFIRSGAEEMEINAVLEVGARIAGRVLDEQGMPLAGARVIFGNPGGGGVVQTDAEGRFAVYGLTEAPCGGSAALKGYGTAYRRNVPPNTLDVEFRLPKAGKLAGRLLAEPLPEHFTVCLSTYDAELGRPLRIHQQHLSNPPDGRFVLEDVAPGTYWVEIEAPGYEASEQPQVAIGAGQTSPLVSVRLQKK